MKWRMYNFESRPLDYESGQIKAPKLTHKSGECVLESHPHKKGRCGNTFVQTRKYFKYCRDLGGQLTKITPHLSLISGDETIGFQICQVGLASISSFAGVAFREIAKIFGH